MASKDQIFLCFLFLSVKFYYSLAIGVLNTHRHMHKTPCTLIDNMFGHFRCFSLLGCPYDLDFREVRDSSLVLLWAAPLYEGRSPVTGYLLEISQGDESDNWTALNDKPISDTRYKVRSCKSCKA